MTELKKLLIFLCAACCILLTGCGINIEEAADKADSAIGQIGKIHNQAQGELDRIVDQFKDTAGQLKDYYNEKG